MGVEKIKSRVSGLSVMIMTEKRKKCEFPES